MTAPSGPVENVMASNDTDNDTIAVTISWNPPMTPNGILRNYRVTFQQTAEMTYDVGSTSDSNIGCPPINTTNMEEILSGSETMGPLTMITLDDLG